MLFRRKPKIKRSLPRRIINGFIYFGIGIIIALIILFSISQTSTFRSWLRDKLLTTVNGSINGHLTIEGIDGTIFSSLILNNVSIIQQPDTIVYAEKIDVRFSPLEIFFKTIYFRKVEIDNAQINFLKDEKGQLNISKLFPPSKEKTEIDTTSGKFNFKIRVADLSLKNIDLTIQSDENKSSKKIYENLNSDDFRLNKLNLSLSAFVDLVSPEIKVDISNLSANPNLEGFRLKNLSGSFSIKDDEVKITGFSIETARSNLSINASMKNFTVLSGDDFKIEKAPIFLDLNANEFNFDDLTNFIPATGLLQGAVRTRVSANGTLTNLKISDLIISFKETHLRASGGLQDITQGDKMQIDMMFKDTKINPDDANNLLRNIDFPVYNEYGVMQFDTLYFKGNPTNFISAMYVQTQKGKFNGKVSLDLTQEVMLYDINLNTVSLNLQPIIGLSTNLSGALHLKGMGTSPDKMRNVFSLNANTSKIQGRNYQRLKANFTSHDSLTDYNITFQSDTTSGRLSGQINFADLKNPSYNLDASINHFNIGEILKDKDFQSDLNFNISAEGQDFDPDSLDLFAVISIDSSEIRKIKLDNKKMIIDIRKDDGGKRVINLVSNLADITMQGDYSLIDATSIIKTEADLITGFVDHNIRNMNFISDSLTSNEKQEYSLPGKKVDINYAIEFKDFEMLSLLLGNVDMEVDGDINGLLKKSNDSLFANISLKVNYFKYWDNEKLYYVSNLVLNSTAINDFTMEFPSTFNAKVKLSADQIFIDKLFENINLDADVSHRQLTYNVRTKLEDNLYASSDGTVTINKGTANLLLDSLQISYKGFSLWNSDKINIDYYNEHFLVNNFKMTHKPGIVDISGLFSLTNDQNLQVSIKNMPGKDLTARLLDFPPETGFKTNVNLKAFWQGTAQSPQLNMNLILDSVQIRNRKIGVLSSNIKYDNEKMKLDINFLDTLYNIKSPKLDIDGTIPIDLSLIPNEKLKSRREVNLTINANEFELATLSGLFPFIRNLQGKFTAGVNVKGLYENLGLFGNINLDGVSFIARPNNLQYLSNAKISLNNDEVWVDSLLLMNSPSTKNGGTIIAHGEIIHKNFKLQTVDLTANGKIKVLGEETRAVNPSLYGDVTVQTVGDMTYILDNKENNLTADLLLTKGTSVTYSSSNNVFSSQSDKFVYKYKDYSRESEQEASIDSLIFLSRLSGNKKRAESSNENNLKIKIKIELEDEAKMVSVLSREFKQNLTAYLSGDLDYTLTGDKPVVNGELTLMEGSKLEFIKPFQASGTVKFLSDLDDPYLNIVGTYRDYYASSDSLGSGEKEVEIRIKLEGPLSQLNKNFIQKEGTIGVYMKDNNLSDYQLDPTKTSSDAIMFIIVGKFTNDATSQDTKIASSTAASFAGSLVGSFLNEKFGDYVRSVRFQQVGTETKVSLIGKAGPVRYEIGGTSQVFQDLSRANVKIEYPPFTSLRNLILRLERREPLQGTATSSEMISEFGIKYRFDF